MCFSATASFTSAAILPLFSLIGLKQAYKKDKRLIAINLLPLCFAVQQFSEGMIWLLAYHTDTQYWAYLFLFFAFFFFPWFIPLSLHIACKKNKALFRVLIVTGFILGCWLFAGVVLTPDIFGKPLGWHIMYSCQLLGASQNNMMSTRYTLTTLATLTYLITTSGAIMFTDLPFGKPIGKIALALMLICLFIYQQYFISTWCFFAAIMSGSILLVTIKYRSEQNTTDQLIKENA